MGLPKMFTPKTIGELKAKIAKTKRNGETWDCDMRELQITELKSNLFNGCTALTSVTIPKSVTEIGDSAFKGCRALRSIHLHWTQLDNIKIDKEVALIGKDDSVNFEECTLYVPPGTRWEYLHHPVFGQFKNIEIEKQE